MLLIQDISHTSVKTVECRLITSIIERCIVTAADVLRRNDRAPVFRYREAIKFDISIVLAYIKV